MTRPRPRCSHPECTKPAVRGQEFCRRHLPAQPDAPSAQPTTSGTAEHSASPGEATPASLYSFYASVFTADELQEITDQLQAPELSTEMEVAAMRVLIRRVMQRIGLDDPVKALPLIRQGLDAICRALRTNRLLQGESGDSLTGALATALREVGEEMGVDVD